MYDNLTFASKHEYKKRKFVQSQYDLHPKCKQNTILLCLILSQFGLCLMLPFVNISHIFSMY